MEGIRMHAILLLVLTTFAAVIDSEAEIVRRGKELSKIVPYNGSFYIADGNKAYKLNYRFDEVMKEDISVPDSDTVALILVDDKTDCLIVCGHYGVSWKETDDSLRMIEQFKIGDEFKKTGSVYVELKEHATTDLESIECSECYRYYSSGQSPIKLDFVNKTSAEEGYITTFSKTNLESSDVILAGTANGFVLKYLLHGDKNISKFTSFQMEKDGHTPVYKFSSTDCSEFMSCEQTMEGKNPLCGWCVYSQRATRRIACTYQKYQNHWLSALSNCSSLQLQPTGILIGKNKTVKDCPHLERIHSKYIPSGVETNLTLEIGNLNNLNITTEFSIHVEFQQKPFGCSDITNGSINCTVNWMCTLGRYSYDKQNKTGFSIYDVMYKSEEPTVLLPIWKGQDDVYVQSMEPKKGPAIGGTVISLFGKNLGIGNRVVQNVKFLSREGVLPTSTCKHSKVQSEHLAMTVFENFYVTCEVSIDVDREPGTNMTFKELEIPVNQRIEGKNENCIIDPNSADQVLCKVPNATVGVRNALESNTPSNSQRKKRSSHCDGCVTVDILVKLDGVESHFTISYYHDPSINKFDENVLLYQTDQQYLEIKGENLNLVAEMHDINVTIGLGECNVVELTGTYMRCKAPSSQPQPGIPGATLPEVNVTIGNIQRTVGYIEYQKKFENVLIIAGAAAGTALFLLVLVITIVCFLTVVAFFVCKYRKVGSKAKALEKQLNDLELEIKHVAKEEFLDMQTSMSTVNRNLIEQGFPFHSYQQYACNAMFATDYLMSDPVMSDELRARARTGMERFQGLLENNYSIRIWAMLIKTPSILFDINAPSYVSESLDVISQVFIESFSRTEQAVSKNQQETTFNKNAALYRLYEQIKPYTDEILDDLSICQETRCLQLNKNLKIL
ncbi:PLXB1-like protein [Mya arenaria]|uniref:PLXB1-like protein n=1 Tax=Mya arenaria TaxID=6604 RepID=A0ABY7FUP4_MYAAR|nr:PLXB1-like protein [Mya arenaria]